jgi:hypothetical protein
MERASKLIRGLRLPGDTISPEELACAAWAAAVGKKIASHTRATRLVRDRLVVEVEDKTWQRQLFTLTHFILRNLERHLGRGLVGDLEFRVVPRRREPQRAALAIPGLFADEACGIEDPVLRSIYRAARKRAQA